jgi:hypothetical protein
MNKYCQKDCKHKDYCKLDEEQTKKCKVDAKKDGKILGRSFDEINAMQHGRKHETR